MKKISRRSFLTVCGAAAAAAALSEQAQAFVNFATSKDAADLIRTAGAVPVNE